MNQANIYHGGGFGGCGGFPATGPLPLTRFVNSASSEGTSGTTSATFQLKTSLSFTAVTGTKYLIQGYCEIEAPADEDTEAQLTIGGTEYCFSHWRNPPYATRWYSWNTGWYYSNALNGSITVAINWRNGYGAGTKNIRRARLIVLIVD